MALLSVEEALSRVLEGGEVQGGETVALVEAAGRVLGADLTARLTQPPFAASAMDGYAVRAADVVSLPSHLQVIGEATAGSAFAGVVGNGEAVRIFTGAPVPDGADAIVIQENTRRSGSTVEVVDGAPDPAHLRPRGGDFARGQTLLRTGEILNAHRITLAAAMGYAEVVVARRPLVAILATGNELVPPGVAPGPSQIVCSNTYGIAALVAAAGGVPRLLGIARDDAQDLSARITSAADCDVLVTTGGASVGDHDLVGPVLATLGMTPAFWKIAMRPGKPMLFGRLGAQRVLGLPGNPVSALVCARLFLVPLVHRLLGRPQGHAEPVTARVVVPLEANGPRQHYMRAMTVGRSEEGAHRVEPCANQDSSLMTPLAAADCLIVRPPNAPALHAGASVPILPLET